jgi:hypothetical protein
MRLKLVVLCCLSALSCDAQKGDLVSSLTSYPIPTNRDSITSLITFHKRCIVSIKEGKVYAEDNKLSKKESLLPFVVKEGGDISLRGKESILKVDDGYLVGFNGGEWGGDLYWFSADGSAHYKISGNNIIQFIKNGDSIYVIEGLAHLSLSEGSIMQIKKINNKWLATTYAVLPTAPEVVVLDSNGNFIIVTDKSLLQIDNKASIKILVEKGIWYYADPTSMVVADNAVFIGMQGGVFKYNLITGGQEFLKRR